MDVTWATARRVPVSVVIPARDASRWLESCVAAVRANNPAEVIIVTGPSSDDTLQIAHRVADRVLHDGGAGVAAARMLGASVATEQWLAFVDVDVLLPPGALEDMLAEAEETGVDGLQAGLVSTGEGDYWSSALAHHHNTGRSRRWFALSATLIRRDLVLANPLDSSFRSGEDIEYRHRLRALGARLAVSRRVVARHRFAAGFEFARDQWLADGAGWGRLARRFGPSAAVRATTPFGAALVGIARAGTGGYRWVPYYVAFAVGNLLGLLRGLSDSTVLPSWRRVPGTRLDDGRPQEEVPAEAADEVVPGLVSNGLVAVMLGIAAAIAYTLGVLRTLPGTVALAGAAVLVVAELWQTGGALDGERSFPWAMAWRWVVGALVLGIGIVRLATVLRLFP